MFIYSACRIPFIIFRLRYGRRVGVYENHSGWNREILNDATDKRRRQRNNHQHKIRNNDWIDNWRQIERTNKRQKIIIYGIEWFLAVFNTQLISFIKMCFRFIFTKYFVNVFVIFIARNSHPVITLGILSFLLCNKYITGRWWYRNIDAENYCMWNNIYRAIGNIITASESIQKLQTHAGFY